MKRSEIKSLRDLYNYYKGIPPSRWTTDLYTANWDRRCHCAFGHLGVEVNKYTPLSQAVDKVMIPARFHLMEINDGDHGYADYGESPKERVLTGLRKLIRKIGNVGLFTDR